MAIEVQILYSEGCAHASSTEALVHSVAKELGLDIRVEMIRVGNEDQARRLEYLGSPTVRVNGKDIDAAGHSSGVFGTS